MASATPSLRLCARVAPSSVVLVRPTVTTSTRSSLSTQRRYAGTDPFTTDPLAERDDERKGKSKEKEKDEEAESGFVFPELPSKRKIGSWNWKTGTWDVLKPGEKRPPRAKTVFEALKKEYEPIFKADARDQSQKFKEVLADHGFVYREGKRAGSKWWVNPDDEVDTDLWTGEDEGKDTFDEDDILSMAHLKLEEHREHREFARIAAWEMPLLSEMAKEYEAPNRDQVLRFRHTTYLGEYHPSERKVVVEFCPDDIPFEEAWQKDKLKKLAGVRFNPEKNVIKMSCEAYEHAAQNKRRLGDLVGNLIREAMSDQDRFEDVPLDLRHHTFKSKPKFPVAWRLTDARVAEIQDHRSSTAELDRERLDGNKVVIRSFGSKTPVEMPTAGVKALPHEVPATDELQAPETVPEMAPEMIPRAPDPTWQPKA